MISRISCSLPWRKGRAEILSPVVAVMKGFCWTPQSKKAIFHELGVQSSLCESTWRQIQTKSSPNTYVQVGYNFHKKKSELFACWNCFRLLLKALASENSFLTFFSFFPDKENVSIQHLHRVTRGIQLHYNILLRWAIKISVATAKQHLLQDIEDIPAYEAVRIALCPEFQPEVSDLLYWAASRCSRSREEFGYWRKLAFWTLELHTNFSEN